MFENEIVVSVIDELHRYYGYKKANQNEVIIYEGRLN